MGSRALLVAAVCAAMASSVSSFVPQPMPPRGVGSMGKGKGSALRIHRQALGTTMLAPSGIDGLPIIQQQLVFAGIYAGLGLGTAAAQPLLGALEKALPDGWFENWSKTWSALGIVFMLAGVAHFTAQGAFMSIYPPAGTWGMWALPGSAEFHVAWTGVAELLGGLGLVGGSLLSAFGPESVKPTARKIVPVAAASLAGLTLAVSPANIYMYTHGAMMVGAGPPGPVPVSFHYGRFVAQIVILSLLVATAVRTSSPAADE